MGLAAELGSSYRIGIGFAASVGGCAGRAIIFARLIASGKAGCGGNRTANFARRTDAASAASNYNTRATSVGGCGNITAAPPNTTRSRTASHGIECTNVVGAVVAASRGIGHGRGQHPPCISQQWLLRHRRHAQLPRRRRRRTLQHM